MPIVPKGYTPDLSRMHIVLEGLAHKQFETLAQNGLLVAATIVEDDAKRRAPKHIADHIQHSQVRKIDENHYEVEVFVKLSDAPDAGAWEYGSGLHREKGTPGKYEIRAVNAPNLVFFWEKEGRMFVGPLVHHPGIAPRPYLRPAAFENYERIKEEFRGRTRW